MSPEGVTFTFCWLPVPGLYILRAGPEGAHYQHVVWVPGASSLAFVWQLFVIARGIAFSVFFIEGAVSCTSCFIKIKPAPLLCLRNKLQHIHIRTSLAFTLILI